jgi:hypothetical protein
MYEFLTNPPTPIARYTKGDAFVSTIGDVSDGEKPYETALQHPDYNNGKIIIVEKYDTEEEALEGHGKWTDLLVTGNLPEEITDCSNSHIQQLMDSFQGEPSTFKRSAKH